MLAIPIFASMSARFQNEFRVEITNGLIRILVPCRIHWMKTVSPDFDNPAFGIQFCIPDGRSQSAAAAEYERYRKFWPPFPRQPPQLWRVWPRIFCSWVVPLSSDNIMRTGSRTILNPARHRSASKSNPATSQAWSGPTRNVFVLVSEIPAWWLSVICMFPGLFYYVRRAVRKHCGRCTTCGYLLCHNTSGKCPECGNSCSLEICDRD